MVSVYDKHSFGSECPECLDLLLWSWGHGLANKAETFLGETKAIKTRLDHPRPDLQAIRKKLDNIDRVAQELREFASPFLIEALSVNQLIIQRIRELRDTDPYNAVTYRVELDPSEPFVRVNAVWLRRLLDILIDNAVDASRRGAGGQIGINTHRDSQAAIIIVGDTGRGMEGRAASRVFAKPLSLESGGRGRGTYIAKLIVDIFGGEISINETGPAGTKIAVRLPLADKSIRRRPRR